jgi:hypothetical protein
VKLVWIVAAHLVKNRAIRSYRGRLHLGVGKTGVADASLIADALKGFAIVWVINIST